MDTVLILFDVDGTLIDVAGAGRRSVHAALVDVFGVERERVDAARVAFAGRTDPVIFRSLMMALGLGDGAYDRFASRLHEAYYRHLERELERREPARRVLPGVVALLESLSDDPGAVVGLITGNLERGARIKLGAFGLNRYFVDGGFASDSADRRVIARRAAEKMRTRLGIDVPRDRTVVVGDTELDVDCARANGFRCVAVGTGGAGVERMAAWSCDERLRDLSDLDRVRSALGLDRRCTSA